VVNGRGGKSNECFPLAQPASKPRGGVKKEENKGVRTGEREGGKKKEREGKGMRVKQE